VLFPFSRILALVPAFVALKIVEIPAALFLAFWFLLQALGSFGSIAYTTASQAGAAFWAQAAGIAAGAAGVFVFRRPERLRVEWWSE
jgi:membrane associated rhomboid family serine protease